MGGLFVLPSRGAGAGLIPIFPHAAGRSRSSLPKHQGSHDPCRKRLREVLNGLGCHRENESIEAHGA